MSDQRDADSVLITDAQMSYDEELAVRKRRYKWMMGMRIPCMILAAVFYQVPWVAVTLLVISIPLPWIAVLVANDRLPRKVEQPSRYRPDRPELESRPYEVIDSSEPASGTAPPAADPAADAPDGTPGATGTASGPRPGPGG
ncbi:DUF3099 domain-containing protein [Pseudonocardia nantongensis]|uniref:DUF3099 domain-containing protein n=1 Tax=Pseudonocardia nantongensis TaxID=1181885 RepID=UPI00397DE5D7